MAVMHQVPEQQLTCGRQRLPALVGVIACFAACQRAPDTPPSPEPPPSSSMKVRWAGCESVRAGPICGLGEARALTLWIAGGEHPNLRARAASKWLTLSAGTPHGGGMRYRVAIPANARKLELTDARGAAWALRIETINSPPALVSANSLRRRGQLDQAAAILGRALDGFGHADRLRARAVLARLALARGDALAAAEQLTRTSRDAAASGHISQAVHDAFALSFALVVNLRRFDRARGVLDHARILVADYPMGRAIHPYYEGLLAWESGDVRGALGLFRESVARAEALDLGPELRQARQQIALTLASLGRTKPALRLQRSQIQGVDAEPACSQADVYTNLAWIAALSRQSDAAGTADPDPALKRATELLNACGDPFRARNGLINEALWALQRSDRDAARRAVRRLRGIKGGHSAALSIWEVDVRARLALADGRTARAVALFERERYLAHSAGHVEGLFRAEAGRGQALERRGQLRRAVKAYQGAEKTLSRWLDGLPLQEGRDAFLSDRDDNARRLVDALLRLGRADQAAEVARLARARLLRATTRVERLARLPPEQRRSWDRAIGQYRKLRDQAEADATQDWTLPDSALAGTRAQRRQRMLAIQAALDRAFAILHRAPRHRTQALRQPTDQELFLVYFPGRQHMFGFAVSREAVVGLNLGKVGDAESPPAALASALLMPFQNQIKMAKRLYLFPYGPLEAVDFHALPWEGSALVDHAVVLYGTDTLGAVMNPAPGAQQDAALIVADPQGDLPHARREARLVQAALGNAPCHVLSGEAATRAETLQRLPRSWLFHYAGHGWFGGVEGADSALPLGDGSRMLLGDILALPSAPRLVVLSACQSGAAMGKRDKTASLGLAQAFVLSGSAAVVAPVRTVADRVARRLTRELYAALQRNPCQRGRCQWDLGAALQTAQLRLRSAMPSADWQSFRALVP